MMAGMKPGSMLFWDVDTQVDFLDPAGKLYVPGSERIIPNLGALTKFAAAKNILVIASADAHTMQDPEFQEYPPHCLQGTPGQQKVPETVLPRHCIVPNHPAELPRVLENFQQLIVEKQATDVFTNPNVEKLLERVGKREILLYGVVTEICLSLAAQGLRQRGYKVHMVKDAVAHLDEEKGRQVAADIERGGGMLLTTADIVSSAGARDRR
jgi:nicotinamidase/pyrazinamidase